MTLLDRRKHQLFQPLLYQVAAAALSPADIAAPIRATLRGQKNARILMDEVVGVDVETRTIHTTRESIGFDSLVVAAGAAHSYFGNDHWAAWAPGLKTIDDAVAIRSRFLRRFEAAAREADLQARRSLLTTIVIGAGPTGVEMAGAMIEIAHEALLRDFPEIGREDLRIVLVEGSERVLPGFPEAASRRARRDLEGMGVEVRAGAMATGIDGLGVTLQRGQSVERIESRNIIWAAGVKASPLGAMLGADTDAGGRVKVGADLSVPGRPNIFVLGDMACFIDGVTGDEVPGMAPGALQMGRYCARVLAREACGSAAARPPFRYRDKGMLATIGRGRAVACLGGRIFGGKVAWLLWAAVHIFYLIGFRNRMMVMLQWGWQYLTWQRGARLITGAPGPQDEDGAAPPPRTVPHDEPPRA
jgi:NADH dehydrogenase